MEVFTVGAIPPMPVVSAAAGGGFFRLRPLPIAFSANEQRVLYPTPSAVVARSLPEFLNYDVKLVETFAGNKTPLIGCGASPSGDLIVAADAKGSVYVWRGVARQLGHAASPLASPSTSPTKDSSNQPSVYSLGLGLLHITGFAFADDGRHMVVHGVDKYAKKLAAVIIPDAGNAVGAIEGHTKGILAAHFRCTQGSNRNRFVATAGADGKICLHCGPPFKLRASQQVQNRQPLNSVQFSPDGRQLVTGGDDGCLRFWQWGESQMLVQLREESLGSGEPINFVIWSLDSERLLVVTAKGRLIILEADSLRVLDEADLVHCSGPDMREVAASGGVTAGSVTAQPVAVQYAATNEWGVVLLEDCSVQGFRTVENLRRFDSAKSFIWRGIKGGSTCAVLNPLTEMLCVGDSTGTLLFLAMRNGEPHPIKALQQPDSRATIRSVAVGSRVAAVIAMDCKLRLIAIPSVAASAAPTRVISKSRVERELQRNQPQNGSGILTPRTADNSANNSPANSPRTAGPGGGALHRQWTLGSSPASELWELVGTADFKEPPLVALKVVEDNALLVLSSSGSIRCFPFERTTQGSNFSELWHVKVEGAIYGAAVSIDGSLVAVMVAPAANYPTEKLGDGSRLERVTKTVLELYELDGFGSAADLRLACAYELSELEVTAVDLSPSGTHVAWADSSKAISVMEVETGEFVVKSDWRMHNTRLTTLCWSPDGTKLATGSRDKHIIIFDLNFHSRYIMIEDCHQGGCTSVQFLLSNLVLSTGADGTLSMNEFDFGPPPRDVKPYVYAGGSLE